jgi:PAS domain S-box-containing protein
MPITDEFRLLVESVTDYAIFLLDPAGHVLSWNAGAERIKGYAATEILGEHFSRFYQPEDRAADLPGRALAEAVRKGRYEAYGLRVRKDDTRFYAHVTITPLFDEMGNVHGFAKVTQDVTAQRETERMLREREQQLAEAQAIAQLGSFEWDIASDRMSWSPELQRIFGLGREQAVTTLQAFVDCAHPDDREAVAETLRGAARSGAPFQAEERITRPAGDVRTLLSWGRIARDEQGHPSRVIGACQDVTEQRERERRFTEAHTQAELSRQLQRELLPTLSLHDPTMVLRTRYRPGQRRALLGADFFDTLELDDGTIAVLIGDVAGHGVDGAAVGVTLRAAWRALTLCGHQLCQVLDGLDRVLARDRPSEEMFATVCCMRIAPDRRWLMVSSAGHPPPLLATGGEAGPVQPVGEPALGILEHGYPWRTVTLRLADAWTLLCYTDGLIEGLRAPGSTDRFGIEALTASAMELLASRADVDGLLDGLLDVVHEANGGPLSDDVAILCLRLNR